MAEMEKEELSNDQHARVSCMTTKGRLVMDFHRDWSPLGFERAVSLFEKGFYDHSHFFRVIPDFLVQFGISYNPELQEQSTIPDEPQLNPRIPFELGTIAFAGSGENSRDTHLFIALDPSGDPQLGKDEPWETPVGRVVEGLDAVVKHLYSYGDDAELPEQGHIYDGPEYIEENFPLTDRFETCTVERYRGHYRPRLEQEVHIGSDGIHSSSEAVNGVEAVVQPLDPKLALLGCVGLVLLGTFTIKCFFAPRKIADKRN